MPVLLILAEFGCLVAVLWRAFTGAVRMLLLREGFAVVVRLVDFTTERASRVLSSHQ